MRKAVTVIGVISVVLLGSGLALTQGPQSAPMTFFITSNGSGEGADLGGLAEADAICQRLATDVDAGDQTHYNFVRPHSALRFGRETRTPAMQAGLVSTRLALSDIFTTGRVTLRMLVAVIVTGTAELPRLSWQHGQRTAA